MTRPIAVSLVLCAAFTTLAAGQQTPPAVHAVRTAAPPRIDGDLSDPAWATATPVTSFTQHNPDDGKPATQPMSVRVLYDDDAVYVGAEMTDVARPDTRLARRDTAVETDWFGFEVDPRRDRRTGAAFVVTASGVQYDEILYNDTYSDGDWDAVWTSATHVSDRGWSAEMRIPYSQLRFPDRDVHVWGVNFIRNYLRNHEEDYLVNTPKNQTGGVSRFAEMTGIEGIHAKRALEVVPYGVARSDLDYTVANADPLNDQRRARVTGGVDAKYRVGSDLTLTGTINPDFGQVEVDPAVVNLSQFEQFFPEKRPFFTEGANLFAFGQGASNNNFGFNFFTPEPFYSRRIGRPPQNSWALGGDWNTAPTETTILGAAKLTGRTESGWSLGALDAVTNRERGFAIDPSGAMRSQLVEPAANYFVFRPAKDIGTEARVGFFLTSIRRNLTPELQNLRREAWSAGTDGWLFFDKHSWILQWMVLGTRVAGSQQAIGATQNSSARYYNRPDASYLDYDPSRTSLSGFGGRVTLAKQTGRWRWNLQAQTYSPGFDVNDIGFMQRADETATHAVLYYNNPDQTRLFRGRSFWIGKWQHFNYGGDVISNGLGASYSANFRNYMSGYLQVFRNFPHANDRDTRGGPRTSDPGNASVNASIGTNPTAKFVAWLSGSHWVSRSGSHDASGTLELQWRPNSSLNFEVDPTFYRSHDVVQYVTAVDDPLAAATFGRRYVFATIEQRQLELPIRAEWTYSPRLSFQLFLQPLISSGDYSDFKELNRPLSLDWAVYGRDRGAIAFDAMTNQYSVNPQSGAASFAFGNPDFDFRSVRGSAVVRWEFRPGSALYVVWNENRADTLSNGDFRLRRDLNGVLRAPTRDVFLIKVAYWLPM